MRYVAAGASVRSGNTVWVATFFGSSTSGATHELAVSISGDGQ
jgi:hypothetical protein